MPAFHTRTIESILDPVAQQVSKLVILHEEAEDGIPMPDLELPVKSVSTAVYNLVKVGRETINSSEDALLRQDMPSALVRVERSSKWLEEASSMLKIDPFSSPARKLLIEGSGGILQATSALLLCFDESEVRKIIRECHRVLDYLAVTEVIETLDELVQFLRDLSPCLARVSREVSARQQELTHQIHAQVLGRCLDQVKSLAPILICAMKVYIHIVNEQNASGQANGKAASVVLREAAENRNYLAQRMSDEVNEIIRVLQLTSYDEEQSDLDNLTVLKKLQSSIQNRYHTALDWVLDVGAVRGGAGEKAMRHIVHAAGERVAARCLPGDANVLRKLSSELHTMTDAMCELRNLNTGGGTSLQNESLGRSAKEKLQQLQHTVGTAIAAVDKTGVQQAAHTVQGRLEQARKWLHNPGYDDKGLGKRAIDLIVEEGRKVADGLVGVQKSELLQLCDQVERTSRDLERMCLQGLGESDEAIALARQLARNLVALKEGINQAVVGRVVEDFIDIVTPLKQFQEAVIAPEGTPNREQTFTTRAQQLQQFTDRAVRTARMVAAGGNGGNKQLAEWLQSDAQHMSTLCPQLIAAGSIRMHYAHSKAADEHFENLRQQYADLITRMRNLCDEATYCADFVRSSLDQMRKHTVLCEDAISARQPHKMVDNTSAIARLANRVLLVAKQECDNSEDPHFIDVMAKAADRLQTAIPHVVQTAKLVALNMADVAAVTKWREANRALLNAAEDLYKAVEPGPELPVLPSMADLYLDDAPPRPPLPDDLHQRAHATDSARSFVPSLAPPPSSVSPGGHQHSDHDEDDDVVFRHEPNAAQPIMVAAHNLHREVRQWSAKDNELIAAAKRMAILMARLSELVHNDDKGSKRELIATAKAIADASADVTRIAKQLARECTDKRIRTNLLQVCERIPTIATQLKILSTVKATMLGAQGSDEDREATEMLEGNAQNLMQSVKETVRAAEGASVKIHAQTHGKLRWVRRQPWYAYA